MKSSNASRSRSLIPYYLIAFSILAAAVFVLGYYIERDETPKTIIKISQTSNIDSVETILEANVIGIEGPAPDIVWLNEKTGAEVSEEFIFTNSTPFTKEQKTLLRKEMVKMGYKRVLESCRGLTDNKFRWTVGYCTYRDAPLGPES